MQLQDLCNALNHYPLIRVLDISKLIKFLRYCAIARPSIEAQTRNSRTPPNTISMDTQVLLSEAIGENILVIRELWSALKEEAWKLCASGDSPNGVVPTADEIATFNTYALCLKTCTCIGIYLMYPSNTFSQHISTFSPQLASVFFVDARTFESQTSFPLSRNLARTKRHCLLCTRVLYLFIQHLCTAEVSIFLNYSIYLTYLCY